MQLLKKMILAQMFCLFAITNFAQKLTYKKMLDTLLKHTVNEISPRSAACKAGVIFLDARPAAEYNVSHLPHAIQVGFTDFNFDKLAGINKTSAIIVYCSVGYRSEKIAEKLVAAGYTDVQNLYGGIFQWANEGRPLKDSAGLTRSVHPYNKTWGKWLLNSSKKDR